MDGDQEKYYERLKAKMKSIYNSLGGADCPVLGVRVIFNAKGFYHLGYKPDGKQREVAERIYKLLLVPYAAAGISNATTIHEERSVVIRPNRKKTSGRIVGKQYAIVATVQTAKGHALKIRVIVVKMEGTDPIFWSIMKH